MQAKPMRGVQNLEQDLIVIESYEDLLARSGFKPSLTFYPKADPEPAGPRFDAVRVTRKPALDV